MNFEYLYVVVFDAVTSINYLNRNLPQAENIPTEDFSINEKKERKKKQCYELNRSARNRK